MKITTWKRRTGKNSARIRTLIVCIALVENLAEPIFRCVLESKVIHFKEVRIDLAAGRC